MAIVETKAAGKTDWIFANPWLWLALGVGFTIWAGLWTLVFRDTASDLRVIVLAVGFLFVGIGVWMRLNDRETLYVLPRSAGLANFARLALAGLFALLAIGVTAIFAMTWFADERFPFKSGATFLIWLTFVPISIAAARRCFQREPKQESLDAEEEIGLYLAVAAIIALAGSGVFYVGEEYQTEWDTFRMFLRVLTSLCLLGSGLVLASIALRRLIISLLAVLHLGAIVSVILSAEPSPEVTRQLSYRVFRPYIEFMYLLNAYRFYSPEPSAASNLWFRLIYADANGKVFGWWYKTPQMDEKGRVLHPIGLEYQRYLALSEAVPTSGQISMLINGPDGRPTENPQWMNRVLLDPSPKPIKVGERQPPPNQLFIPMHPRIPLNMQTAVPTPDARKLYESYVRFLAHKYGTHPENPTWKLQSVKVYRIVHQILVPEQVANRISPMDPEQYHAHYVGQFRPNGKEFNEGDPYRHWLLPILREVPNNPDAAIYDYVRLHAGDPNWYRPAGMKNWVEIPPPQPPGIAEQLHLKK